MTIERYNARYSKNLGCHNKGCVCKIHRDVPILSYQFTGSFDVWISRLRKSIEADFQLPNEFFLRVPAYFPKNI